MKKNRFVPILTLMLCIMQSCQEEEFITPQTSETETIELGNMTKLGKQLENPYSIENMRKALEELSNSGLKSSSIDEIEIEPTHLYVKFKPKNDDELNILKSDSTLCLYSYPLDYEIVEEGEYYHDPEVPEDQPTFQYASVVLGKELPEGIDYEVLSELFVIEDKEDDSETENQLKSAKISYSDWDALEDKALKMTGNIEESNNSGSYLKASKWRPSGRIQVWDDDKERYVGVEGVKVRARRWFTTHTGIANANGDYSCDGRFRYAANYSIIWERYHFEIRNSWLGRSEYDGPKKRGSWYLDIKDGRQEFYATIFRAAHHYYYKDIKGLRRPPLNGFFKTQLKIRAYNEKNDGKNGNYAPFRGFLGLGSAIKIYNPQNYSSKIYGTTIHELAHASHWNMNQITYLLTESIVKESWARGVQWELTRMVYPTYKPTYHRGTYTGIVEDMIDGVKVRTSYSYKKNVDDNAISITESYNDIVSGYTIRQLEDALNGKNKWKEWKDNIKNKYNNATENNIDAAFHFWISKQL